VSVRFRVSGVDFLITRAGWVRVVTVALATMAAPLQSAPSWEDPYCDPFGEAMQHAYQSDTVGITGHDYAYVLSLYPAAPQCEWFEEDLAIEPYETPLAPCVDHTEMRKDIVECPPGTTGNYDELFLFEIEHNNCHSGDFGCRCDIDLTKTEIDGTCTAPPRKAAKGYG
jgi:hypothetical protein